jgi:hypothetical protein
MMATIERVVHRPWFWIAGIAVALVVVAAILVAVFSGGGGGGGGGGY